MGQTHTDVQRITSELKRTIDSDKVHLEGQIAAGGNFSSTKSNTTSLKMLLAKETSKEVESKSNPRSVVARLMGLEEDFPAKEPVLHHAKRDFWRSKSSNRLKETKALQQHDSIQSVMKVIHPSCETIECNGVYEGCEEKARMSLFQDQSSQRGRYSENRSGTMDIVPEKFREGKCLATEENLLHSGGLQESLEVVSSEKDLFLRFRDERNFILQRRMSRLHTTPASPQTKRITVLKPMRSVECNGGRQSRTERAIGQNGLEMRKFDERPSSKEGIPSQPSRIVLLRPTPGKPSMTKAKLTPKAIPFRQIKWNDFNGVLDDSGVTLGSRHRQYGFHQRDESLLSSRYSNGYGGDESSFTDSEIDCNGDSGVDYIEEDDGSFSDSDEDSAVLKYSWDHTRRYGSPCPGSSFSKISHFPESLVIKEAKQRLSERWAMVTCDEISEEQVQLPRRTRTLGEMLSLQEVKKEDSISGVHSVSSSRSCGTENELTTTAMYVATCRKLPRSKSVLAISKTSDNMVEKVQVPNTESCKPTSQVSNKGKPSFKGRVSDFFFPKRKPIRHKSTHHPSDCFDDIVEACFSDSQSDANHNVENNEEQVLCEEKIYISAIKKSISTSEGTASVDVPISLVCPSRELDILGLNEGLNSTRDQPSPTSVLDAPSEDSSCNEPESSGSTTSKNAKAVSRSSVIEAVACSLPWDDASSESPSVGIPRLPCLPSNIDDDESECHVLVQNIMSSAGLDDTHSSMVFTGWHLPDCPVDPVLCNKLLALREQRSCQRLLFDCVNVALVEIGENALLSAFSWSKAHTRTWRYISSPALGVEVWSILKDWIYGTRMFVVSKRDSTGIMMDRIVKQEVEGSSWVKMMISQVVDITEQIEEGVLEELVGEALQDFVTCFQQ